MAAQERAKQGSSGGAAVEPQPVEPPPPAFDDDLLMSMDDDQPPQQQYYQQQQPPPPAFDAVAPSLFAAQAPPTIQTAAPPMQWDPHAPSYSHAPSAPSASAPAMEDLYHTDTHNDPAPPMPPPTMDDWGSMQVMAPPSDIQQNYTASSIDDLIAGMDPEAVQMILGMDGMSDEEKREMLEEQAKILADIERKKAAATNTTATARADAFEQRSYGAAVQSVGSSSGSGTRGSRKPAPAAASSSSDTRTVNLGSGQEVALHGQEKTRQAIEEGTAILVQCLSCSNWMQVTESATLMFCPVCQVVSPVEKTQTAATQQEATQFKSDQELAEQLQKEEYDVAGREERQRAAKKAAKAKRTVQEEQSQSWMEWMGLSSPTAAAAHSGSARPSSQPPAFAIPAERPRERGEMGVSRPPGSSLSAARTGEETHTINFSNSYDEQEGLMGSGGGSPRRLPAARVAQQQPLFNCVADSITSAASQALTALNTHTLSQDEEGNVHGVDASSLLAVTNVGRESTRYEQLNDGNNSNQN